MAKKNILHMVTPLKNISAFDVNMAIDAGYDAIMPYTQIDDTKVADVVQDAIFSRAPGSVRHSGMFIGGYDINLASDMVRAATAALVPPFELSIFADPNGAFTTSAALVAMAEKQLLDAHGRSFEGRHAIIFGGGPVGLSAAVLLAKAGAHVRVAKLTSSKRGSALQDVAERYDVALTHYDAQTEDLRIAAAADCEVLFATAKEGVQVVSRAVLDASRVLAVVGDVNAVPPAGIEGVDIMSQGNPIGTAHGNVASLGALGVGRNKYQLQSDLFADMLVADKPLIVDFFAAFEKARSIVAAT
jgi:methylene-tetrahydromethanopterin dehydrogenase